MFKTKIEDVYDERYYSLLENYYKTDYFGQRRTKVLVEMLPDGRGLCLDAGCGIGEYFVEIVRRGYNVVGVDFSRVAIRKSKECLKNTHFKIHVDLILCSLEHLPFCENTFDFVFSSQVLHYLAYPQKAIYEFRKVSKRNTKMLLSVANPGCLFVITRRVLRLLGLLGWRQNRLHVNEYCSWIFLRYIHRMRLKSLKILSFDVLPPVGVLKDTRSGILDFLLSVEERIRSIFPFNRIGRMLVVIVKKN